MAGPINQTRRPCHLRRRQYLAKESKRDRLPARSIIMTGGVNQEDRARRKPGRNLNSTITY